MRYLGNKTKLLPFIEESIKDINENIETVFDITSGTCSVSEYFKKQNKNVISNDILYLSYVFQKARVCLNKKYDFTKYFNEMKSLPLIDTGFIYNNYTQKADRMFFTEENAKKIDTYRTYIENKYKKKEINEDIYYYLIYCLLEASDKVGNVTGVWESFLKHFKDASAKDIQIKELPYTINNNKKQYICNNEDIINIIDKYEVDLIYFDPPYNTRSYDTNFHLVETIAKYDNPEIQINSKTNKPLKSGKRKNVLKSKLDKKTTAKQEFEKIVNKMKTKYILVSYNNEGIISKEDMKEILSKRGKVKIFEKEYKRYKSNNNKEVPKNIIEYLFLVEVKT